jgi:hypothetical protein
MTNSKQIIIGFAGRKQSGKNTCADYVSNLYNQNNIPTKIYSLADPLKQDICMNLFGLSNDQCYGSDEEKNSLTHLEWKNMPGFEQSWMSANDYDPSGFMTARQVMQFIGTDIFRKIDSDIWVNGMLNKIKREQISVALCCDIRFINEVEKFKNIGGLVIKLTRNPFNSDHSSETALDPDNYDQTNFDLIIDNKLMNIEQQCYELNKFLTKKGLLPL